MRFRTVVIAAVILVLATGGSFAAYTIADQARGEAAQFTVERTDTLAVQSGIVQHLAPDDGHNPTAYGDTVDAELEDGSQLNEGQEYHYYPENGSIEFLVDDEEDAVINFTYEIPEDQVADEQLTTLTEAYGNVAIVAVGLSFVVVFLFIGAFAAKRIGIGQRQTRGR